MITPDLVDDNIRKSTGWVIALNIALIILGVYDRWLVYSR